MKGRTKSLNRVVSIRQIISSVSMKVTVKAVFRLWHLCDLLWQLTAVACGSLLVVIVLS